MSLRYELELLDELIAESLHPKNLIGNNAITNRQITAWLNKALSEKNKARKKFKPVAYSFPEENHRKLYIRQHQSATIHLLDLLFNYLSPKDATGMSEQKTDSHIEKLYKRLFVYCLELLYYIQDTFPEYFAFNQKVSDYELMKSQQEWSSRVIVIRKQLQKIKTNKALVNLLFTILDNICDHTNCIVLSYRTHLYINSLINSIETAKLVKPINVIFPLLETILISHDFNKTEFKNYLVDTICTEVNMLKTTKEKIDKLSFYYKSISQMYVKQGLSFKPGTPSVKDDLKEWLLREIRYLEKSENLGIIVPAHFHDIPQYKKGIWYTYTIEELALLQRVQYDANYITNRNIIAMMEDLSKIAHTATQHNISYKNLKNLFYNIDTDTIDSLHEKFLTMIRKLQNLKAELIKKAKSKRSIGKK